MNQFFRAKRFEMVELQIPTTVTGVNAQINFQQQPQLQSQYADKRIYVKAIEAYTDDIISGNPITSNFAVATAADLQNAVLVLSIQGENQIHNIPLSRLVAQFTQSFTPANLQPLFLRNQWRVDWTKSYIQTLAAPAAPFSYLLGVYYDYYPDNEDYFDPQDPSAIKYATRLQLSPFADQ